MNIQWYPGHMAKTRRTITESLKMVDAVCEILDARIPHASRNPDIDELIQNKPRLIVLNRSDQAIDPITRSWKEAFEQKGFATIIVNSQSGAGFNAFVPAVQNLLKAQIEAKREKGQVGAKTRLMVVGIPNVGKSSFINRIAGKKVSKTENRPGVTRQNQWYAVTNGIELLDTPGVLWPRFDDGKTAVNLALTGAIKDTIIDVETLAVRFLDEAKEIMPEMLQERYKIVVDSSDSGFEILEKCAKQRGLLIKNNEVDTERAAKIILDELRTGKLGRVSLEKPGDFQ